MSRDIELRNFSAGLVENNEMLVVVFVYMDDSTRPDEEGQEGELSGLNLHWACSVGEGKNWEPPPKNWKTNPPVSYDAGGILQAKLRQRIYNRTHIMSACVPANPLLLHLYLTY
jgi:hypothetical protein